MGKILNAERGYAPTQHDPVQRTVTLTFRGWDRVREAIEDGRLRLGVEDTRSLLATCEEKDRR